jgi:hypothetical protein
MRLHAQHKKPTETRSIGLKRLNSLPNYLAALAALTTGAVTGLAARFARRAT